MAIATVNELLEYLKDMRIEQKDFLGRFYDDVVHKYVDKKIKDINENASDVSDENSIKDKFLERHRFDKKIEQIGKVERSPELTAMLLYYFNNNYKQDDVYTVSDREAAWEIFVEIDTRIITQPLENGIDKAALNSLYRLFELHREISKRHGLRCKRYYDLMTSILNDDIRPFTSKWHQRFEAKTNDNVIPDTEFREELKSIQTKMQILKIKLKNIIEN